MLKGRYRIRLGIRSLLLLIAVLALPLSVLRLILNSKYTVVTRLEIVEDNWPGRWPGAESMLRSPAIIAEGLAAQSGLKPRQTAPAALRRLILTRDESDHHLGIWVQLKSDDPIEDKVFLDGLARAFSRTYTRGRVVQSYPATAHMWRRYGPWESVAFVMSCILALGVIFAAFRHEAILDT